MLLPMSMAKSIYRILPDFGAMVLMRLYGKPMKWNNDVSDILKIFLPAMAFVGRFDQPMTRGQINRMSEDIDLDKTHRKGVSL